MNRPSSASTPRAQQQPAMSPRGAPHSTKAAVVAQGIAAQKHEQQQATAATAINGKDKQFRVDSDVRAMTVSGHTVWLAHNDGSLTVRKARTAEIAHHFAAGHGRVWSLLAIAAGGSDYVWVGLSTGDIEVYNAMNREFVKKLSRHTGGVFCFTEFNGQVFSGSNDFEVMQWDALEMSFTRQLTGHTNYVRCLYAEGSALFSGSDDHTVRVWNATTGQHLNTANFHSTGVSAMCRVGMHMWSGDDSGKIAVWRLQTLEHEETLHEHLGRINTIKKVGSRVYSGSADHDIIVWDAYTREQATRISDHRGWVMHLACPAQLSRYYLWSAAADGTVRCWHHDEYRVMNADLERFDDARWYNAEFTPYKELNSTLSQQYAQLERRCDLLQREYTAKAAALMEHTNALASTQAIVKSWQEEVEASRLHVKETDRTNVQLRSAVADKERELLELTQKLKGYQSDNVDLRCQNDRVTLANDELKRRLDLAEKERGKLDAALRETLQSRSDGKGPLPCIIATETQAQESLLSLQRQLADAIQMNQALILDLNRYKGILGIAPTPMPKQVAMGAASPPSRSQVNAAMTLAFQDQQQQQQGQQPQQQQAAAPTAAAGPCTPIYTVTTPERGAADAAAVALAVGPAAPAVALRPASISGTTSSTTPRAVHWASNVGSYVHDRYFKTSIAKAPHVPGGRPSSARRAF